MFNPYQPDPDTSVKPKPPPRTKDWGLVTLDRARYRISIDKPWAREAHLALRYYGSDMYRYTRRERDTRHARMFANYVRRDLDRLIASIIDAELRVRPVARHPKWHAQVKAMFDYLEYTKDSENFREDVRRAITGFFQIGEGVLYEGFDPEGDDGDGVHEAIRLDARRVLVDPKALRLQKDDARWIITYDYVPIEELKDQYGLKNVQAEGQDFFMDAQTPRGLPRLHPGGGVPAARRGVGLARAHVAQAEGGRGGAAVRDDRGEREGREPGPVALRQGEGRPRDVPPSASSTTSSSTTNTAPAVRSAS